MYGLHAVTGREHSELNYVDFEPNKHEKEWQQWQ
jgi:hypothetical protein